MDDHSTLPNSITQRGSEQPAQPTAGPSQVDGVDGTAENEEQTEDTFMDLEDEMFFKDRRRAKSLPAYPEQATLFNEISQSCRKKVKFADALGLSLASVKHFSATEDPKIPSKVFSRLQNFAREPDKDLRDVCEKLGSTLTMDRLVPTFKMPAECKDFESLVKQRQVSLEKVTVTMFDVKGLIKVSAGAGYKKEVGVRYTFNDWLSFVDAQAIAVPVEDSAGTYQRFSFTMYTPPFLEAGSSVHFAVYSKTDQGEFWDNNEGHNYTLKYHCTTSNETAAFNAT
ncbi:protein phosphatase 1 regulatory subunit 3G [Brienomyrus brachyistius]|uniref:protein phosphatase 1 regulatory subunit 3G n=1 Tax=Brienomyrus brachyistius TaxID=42636 RepID=UPI0020B1EBC5|nr:protein phosphatase 1 regulatory subunit 3G [Brienomyrus brachyistius]